MRIRCKRLSVSRRTAASIGRYHAWVMIRGWFLGYLR